MTEMCVIRKVPREIALNKISIMFQFKPKYLTNVFYSEKGWVTLSYRIRDQSMNTLALIILSNTQHILSTSGHAIPKIAATDRYDNNRLYARAGKSSLPSPRSHATSILYKCPGTVQFSFISPRKKETSSESDIVLED